ncbi:DUF167 family protein [Chlamydia pecorum]|uniref:UPF0235 protein cpL1_0517 n=1 Tax=Chlamydia pecorum TaxID=85991 RepID=A0AA40PRB4_9CHLA|nr:DUF167 family protein [Chlamydia pecorum]AGW37751.1 hypothetical protein CPE1_0252 [Chlamydia pecorum PV3056/3]AGW38672.1 hypothetical protein CPE2_0252 [Chlamydia pecorum W73]AGW39597.1 hypothetical protein CPE3_0252 [Chlamydia pecorum P787]ETF37818.1 hypothetical protein CpecS_0509 [Chlamydia pecorum VR629]ETF39405.1 hypothetical protein CpecF_0505 [Chlamydia pecorum DBDeUG]
MDEELCILEVQVTPKAKENKIVGFQGEVLKVRVTEPPEKGKANEAVVSLLAKALGIPKRDVTLVSGESSRKKKLMIPKKVQEKLHVWRS